MRSQPLAEHDLPDFLVRDASDQELRTACVLNHVEWLRRFAAAGGGSSHDADGVFRAHLKEPIPEFHVVVTAPYQPELRSSVDRLLPEARAAGVTRVGYWVADQAFAAPLRGWLGARGFRPGSRPHWMAADLSHVLPPEHDCERAEGVGPVRRLADWSAPELPSFEPQTAAVRDAMAQVRPQRVWNMAMWDGDDPIGQSMITATSGELGVCGLHDTVIRAEARSRGLGVARFHALSRFAQGLGTRYLVLNAEGTPPALFRRLGFSSLGVGETWWLSGDALGRTPPVAEVTFAEAVAAGDVGALDAASASGRDMQAPLPNGLSPLNFAAAVGQQISATWLAEQGAPVDVLSAWDLGWHDTARRLLTADGTARNMQRPRSGKSLLHIAVERNDRGLVELLLATGIDTELRDAHFGSTALDWARALQRPSLAALLEPDRR